MFGLLKNKLSSFIKGLTGREEKNEGSPAPPLKTNEQPKAEEEAQIAIRGKGVEEEPKPEETKKPEKQPEKQKQQPPIKKAEEKTGQKTHPAIETTPKAPEPVHVHGGKKREEEPPGEAGPQKKQEKAPIAVPPSKPAGQKSAATPPEKPAEESRPKKPGTPLPQTEPQKQGEILAQAGIDTPLAKQAAILFSKPDEKNEAEDCKQKEQPKKSIFDSVVGVFSGRKAEERHEPVKTTQHAVEQAEEQSHSKSPAAAAPDWSRLERKAASDRREMAPKIGIGTAVKSLFSSEITIGEAEVSDMLEELELSLLEADVAYEVSTEVTAQLKGRLIGMKVQKSELEPRIKETVRTVLESVMESDRKFDFVKRVRSLEKPAKILFVGPNGAGKTTTMAKIARMLMDAGLTVVFSASDTFRAAAIEQTEVHAGRLGVKVVKSKYGADPASVAFDAVNFARANSTDVVLIDSAGRQDTNANLLSELKKINRIAKPDLKIYIGESIGGNSVIEQIRAFNEAIGVDGAILTKLDCDAKGGTAISIAKSTGIPVIFLGIGQEYSDLVPFDAGKIAREIMT